MRTEDLDATDFYFGLIHDCWYHMLGALCIPEWGLPVFSQETTYITQRIIQCVVNLTTSCIFVLLNTFYIFLPGSLPLAIVIGIPLTTIINVLVNIGYLAIMSREEIMLWDVENCDYRLYSLTYDEPQEVRDRKNGISHCYRLLFILLGITDIRQTTKDYITLANNSLFGKKKIIVFLISIIKLWVWTLHSIGLIPIVFHSLFCDDLYKLLSVLWRT